MNKNKKLFSLVLSGVLASLIFSGCNDDDNVNIPNSQETITAVDDYIYNGILYAVVYDKSTKSIKEIPGKTSVAYMDKNQNLYHSGSENYIKPFLRPEQEILYYKFKKPVNLSNINPICSDTKKYECEPTFVDVNGNGKYDAGIDQTFDEIFYVTKINNDDKINVITPVTTLSLDIIRNENGDADLNTVVKNYLSNNNNDVEKLKNYLHKKNLDVLSIFITKLGYKVDATGDNNINNLLLKIITKDPTKVDNKELKYNLLVNNIVNLVHKKGLAGKFYEQLKKVNDVNIADNETEKILTGLKNLQKTIEEVGDPGLDKAKNVVDKILSYENTTNPVDVLLSINPAMSISKGDLETEKPNISSTDLLIQGIGFKSGTTVVKDFHQIYENGYKVNSGEELNLVLNWYKNGKEINTNFSNKKLDFVIDFKGIGNTEANSTKSLAELQLIIPTKVSATVSGDNILYTSSLDPNDKITANTKFADNTASSISMSLGEVLGAELNKTFDGTNLNLTKIIKAVINKANEKYNQNLPSPITKISNMRVYLDGDGIKNIIVNSENKIVGAVSYKTINVAVPGSKNVISNLIPFINDGLVLTDWRGNRLGENKTPVYKVSIKYPDGIIVKDFNLTNDIASGSDITNKNIIYNVNRSISNQQIQFIFNKTDEDTWETNTKFNLTSEFNASNKNRVLSNIITTSTEVNQTDPAIVTAVLDNNYSDANYNLNGKHPSYLMTYKITDEFGKTNTVSTNIFMNRVPVFVSVVTKDPNIIFKNYLLDNNGTDSNLSSYDNKGNLIDSAVDKNSPVAEPSFLAIDLDGVNDISSTVLKYKILSVDINTSYDYNISNINISDGTVNNVNKTDNFVLFKNYAKEIQIGDGEGNTSKIFIYPNCNETTNLCYFQVAANTSSGKWAADTKVSINLIPKDKYDAQSLQKIDLLIKAHN